MISKGRNSFKHIDFMLLDLLLVQIALPLAYLIRQGDLTLYEKDAYQTCVILLVVAAIVNGFFTENYKNILKRGYMKELVATLKYIVLNVLFLIFWLFFSKQGDQISRSVVIYFVLIFGVASYAMRNLWKIHVRVRIAKNKKNQQHLLVVTHSSIAGDVVAEFLSHMLEPVEVVGLVTVDDGIPTGTMVNGVEVISVYAEAIDYIRVNWVDAVYIKLPHDVRMPESLLNKCATMGVTTYQCLVMESERSVVQSIDRIAGNIVMVESMNIVPPGRLFAKRILDIVGGLVGVVFTLLLMIFVAPAIFFTDPGPILFSQNRVGKNGRIFRIYKFRSMYRDAEKRKKELMEKNTMQGLMFKMDDDPRILGSGPDGKKHGIGWFIRKTSIDEFPQFWNVLKGDMSLVGTRPPTVDEWEQYKLHHRARLAMKPGITGLWQTSGRSQITDFEDVIKLDLQYINSWSIAGDLRLILKTVGEVFKSKGAK